MEELLEEMVNLRDICFDDLYASSLGPAERANDKFATMRILHQINHEIKLVFR